MPKINKRKYKGLGRPKKSDYLPSLWQKWGNTVIFFALFALSVVTWFGGAVRIKTAYAESQGEFLSPIPDKATGWNYTFVDEPVYKEKPTIESLFYKYDWDARLMLAICKSENGYSMWGNQWKPEARYDGNTDGSIDTGICMVNSNTFADFVRRGKLSANLDLTNADDNVYSAYVIWTEQSEDAWTNYSNDNYLVHLEN